MAKKYLMNLIILLSLILVLLSACSPQVQSMPQATPTAKEDLVPVSTGIPSPTFQPGLKDPLPTPGVSVSLEKPFAKVHFQEGPFDFEFYLFQDPGFSQNPSMTWMYSDIPGVGTHVSWVYHGPTLDKPVVESWGICPDISPRNTYPGLKEGDTSIREGGIMLPQDAMSGSVVQFVLTVETSQGTYGGILNFQLLEGSIGVEPSKVTINPLNQSGRMVYCISELQSSFMSKNTSTLQLIL